MTDEREQKPTDGEHGGQGAGEEALAGEESPALAALLKRSLPAPSGEGEDAGAILAGVQQKLRKRSRGKFYADGWSTTQSRVNYALVAAIMLVTIVVVYLALGPTGISLN